MSTAAEDMLLGRLAVHLKMISAQDLVIVTAAQQRGGSTRGLGDTLLDEGLISQTQLVTLQAMAKDHLARQQAHAQQQSGPPPAAAPPPPPKPEPPKPPPPAPKPMMNLDDLLRPFVSDGAAKPTSPTAPTSPSTAAVPTPAAAQPAFAARAQPNAPSFSAAPPSASTSQTIAAVPAAAAVGIAAPAPPKPAGPPPLPPLPPPPPDYRPQVAEVRRDGSLSPRNTDTAALLKVLGEAVRVGASDIHLHERARLRFRIAGALREQRDELLSPYAVGAAVTSALTDAQYDVLCREGELDFPYTAPGIGRFRVNVFKQQHGIDAVFRSVPPQPPSLEELGLPQALGKLANYHQGIVLFTGPSGSGKSATMGAVLNLVNRERNDHIITIEDPIETLHPSLAAIVNQRQAKKHTASFGRALKAALREDPDVIVIGEMRDYETISLAISAAETGHLVMGTLHTGSAIRTISRVLGVFPPAQQAQVRSMVSESLRAVISQRLVARADGNGRVAALEILYVNQAVANLIRENRQIQIKSVLQTGAALGMTSLDNSLEQLVKAGTITKEEAARHADEPKKFTNTGGS
ncbi:MAG TPA: PilT/PilU family type 4a pilus ATPase [Myxococcota bacterium]